MAQVVSTAGALHASPMQTSEHPLHALVQWVVKSMIEVLAHPYLGYTLR